MNSLDDFIFEQLEGIAPLLACIAVVVLIWLAVGLPL